MASRTDDLTVTGTIKCPSTALSPQPRATVLEQEPLVYFPVPMTDLRVWDAMQTNLPGTAATDDLALISTSFGSVAPLVQAGDCKASGGAVTRRAAFVVPVPECYEVGQTMKLAITAGMKTTVSDGTCTVDVEAYRVEKIGGTIGSDLVTTSATTMNSLTFAEKAFTIDPATLAVGDVLHCRVTIVCNDAATGTAVIPTISGIDLVCDIKG